MTRSLRFAALVLTFVILVGALLAATYQWRVRPPRAAIQGRVVDDQGPVAGARVRWQGRPESTLTDAQGRFALAGRGTSTGRVTAWKEGYLVRGALASRAAIEIRLVRLPPSDAGRYQWVDSHPDPQGPLNCGNCHQEVYREWLETTHAHSVTNRRFLNLYDGSDWHGQPDVGWNLMGDFPDGVSVCTTCHAPGVDVADSAWHDLRQATGTGSQGIHCDFCHKVRDAPSSSLGLTHGRDGLDLLLPAHGQVFFGPRDDVDTGRAAYCAGLSAEPVLRVVPRRDPLWRACLQHVQ